MTIREASAVGVEPVVLTSESTVVGLYEPEETDRTGYQSEAELEAAFIRQLQAQAYEYVSFASEDELVANLRTQLEALNDYTWSLYKVVEQVYYFCCRKSFISFS